MQAADLLEGVLPGGVGTGVGATGGAALDAFLALARYADGQYQHIVDHMRSSTYDAKQALMRRAKRDAEQLKGVTANESAPPPPPTPLPLPLLHRTPSPPHTPHPPPLTHVTSRPQTPHATLTHHTPTPHPHRITPPDPALDPTLHPSPAPRSVFSSRYVRLLDKQQVIDVQELQKLAGDRQEFLVCALTNYIKCLQGGATHDLRVFRIASLWFDNGTQPGINAIIQVSWCRFNLSSMEKLSVRCCDKPFN